MIRWSPSSELTNLHTAMDRLFDGFFGSPTTDSGTQRQAPTYVLPLNVKEVESGYEIQAPVPGFSPDEVDVTFADGVLRIQARHSETSTRQEGGYLRREVAYGNVQRSIQLPGDVKEDAISAHFENGVLTVSVPKAPRPQPRKIEVSGGAQKQELGASTS
jgi:HSP20 family protein